MKGILKTFAATALLAALACGTGFAREEVPFDHNSAYIVEDTTRDILSTLQSRLDAVRKVALPQAMLPASEAAGVVVNAAEGGTAEIVESAAVETTTGTGGAALGSLVLPTYIDYGARYLNRFWAGGLGTWQKADKTTSNNGFAYDSYKYDGQGVLLGYERAQGAGVFGIAGSYVKGDYEMGSATRHNSEIAQYSAHLYGAYNNSRGFFFSLAGGYTYGNADIDEESTLRTDTFLRREDYHSHTVNAGVKVGFDFEPSETLFITPSIGANFFHTRSNNHNIDDGDTTVTYRADRIRHNLVEIPLDIQISKEIGFGPNRALQLSANGGYAYNLTNKAASGDVAETPVVGGTSTIFRVVDRELGRSAWKAGVGARLKMDQWDIGVKYDFLKRSDFDAHRLMGTVGFSF